MVETIFCQTKITVRVFVLEKKGSQTTPYRKNRLQKTAILTVTEPSKSYESKSYVETLKNVKAALIDAGKEADNIIKARRDQRGQVLLVVKNNTETLRNIKEHLQSRISGAVAKETPTTKPVVLFSQT